MREPRINLEYQILTKNITKNLTNKKILNIIMLL